MRTCCDYHRLVDSGVRHFLSGFGPPEGDHCRAAKEAPREWIERLKRSEFQDPVEILRELDGESE